MKKWNTISGDFRTKDVSRGMIDSQGRGNENDLANSGETEQSFHGFGFIVDPGTKLARTWRKRATRIQLVLLFPLASGMPGRGTDRFPFRETSRIEIFPRRGGGGGGDILIYGQDGVCPGPGKK